MTNPTTPDQSSTLANVGAPRVELDMELLEAIEADDGGRVTRLLAQGAQIELRGAQGRTPVLAATQLNHVSAARALIDAGADVNAQDDLLDNAYLYAGAEGYVEILELTLAHGADLTRTNRYNGTALIPAGEYGHVRVTQLLLEAGIDPDHVNKLGWTALQEAVLLGADDERHRETVRLLLAGGADPNIRDFEGRTPLANAEAREFSGLAELIEAAGGER